jgi:hypothetical protein
MHLSSLLVVVGLCGALAAPVDQQQQQPQIFRKNDNTQQPQAANPYTPDYRDPYDKKVDAEGRKLQPLPWVRTTTTSTPTLSPSPTQTEHQFPHQFQL